MPVKSLGEELAELLFAKCAENFVFPDSRNPLPGELAPKPSIHVNVKVTASGKIPTSILTIKIIENIIGDEAEGRINADMSLRLMLKNKKLAEKLVKTKTLKLNDIEYNILAVPDKKMNQGRGILFTKDFATWTVDDILDRAKKYGVIEVFPFTRQETVNGTKQAVRTGAYKLTFETTEVPKEMKIAYTKYKVGLYYDNPMFCKNCGQFGHTEKRCTVEKRCLKCGNDDHDTGACENPQKCVNCFKQHELIPRKCPIYKFEQNVIRYAAREQISVSAARKYGMKQITEYIEKVANKPSSAAAVAANEEIVIEEPSWWRTTKVKEEKPKYVPKPIEIKGSYFVTQLVPVRQLQAHELIRKKLANPHQRAQQKEQKKKEQSDEEMKSLDSSDEEDDTSSEYEEDEKISKRQKLA